VKPTQTFTKYFSAQPHRDTSEINRSKRNGVTHNKVQSIFKGRTGLSFKALKNTLIPPVAAKLPLECPPNETV